jgi:hypothetical protein
MPSRIEDYAIIGDTKSSLSSTSLDPSTGGARRESTPAPPSRRCSATRASAMPFGSKLFELGVTSQGALPVT